MVAINDKLIGSGNITSSASNSNPIHAKYLPNTKDHSGADCVNTCSSVPVRRSSLHMRIVSVLASKINSIGIHSNIGRTSAMFLAKNASAQKKINNVVAAKDKKNSHAIGDDRKSLISFRATCQVIRQGFLGCNASSDMLRLLAIYLTGIRLLVLRWLFAVYLNKQAL